MTQEEQNLQTEQASEEQVSQETQKEEVKTEQPLTAEQVRQIAEEAAASAYQRGRREMQGIKDREVADVKRQADLAEKRSKAYEAAFGNLDEDTRLQMEQQKLRGENEYYRSREQEDLIRRQQEEYIGRLQQSLKDEAKAMGIDPGDNRIDYANDASDYFEGRKRFTESLAKITQEERNKLEQTAIQKAEERFKQLETEFRKEHGLDAQDNSQGAGNIIQSDAEFMDAFGRGELPVSKENLKRLEEIQNKNY